MPHQQQRGGTERFTATILKLFSLKVLQSSSALNPESLRSHAGAHFWVNVVSKLRWQVFKQLSACSSVTSHRSASHGSSHGSTPVSFTVEPAKGLEDRRFGSGRRAAHPRLCLCNKKSTFKERLWSGLCVRVMAASKLSLLSHHHYGTQAFYDPGSCFPCPGGIISHIQPLDILGHKHPIITQCEDL